MAKIRKDAISIDISAAELRTIERAAKLSGKSAGAFCRHVLLKAADKSSSTAIQKLWATYPPPWRITVEAKDDGQIFDRSGRRVASFDAAEDGDYHRGIVAVVNEAARTHPPIRKRRARK